MEYIEVDTAALGNDIDLLKNNLKAIENDLEKMFQAGSYLDTMWDREANQIFVSQFKKDKEDMKAVCVSIQEIIKCLDYAKTKYDSCDRNVGEIVSSIAI